MKRFYTSIVCLATLLTSCSVGEQTDTKRLVVVTEKVASAEGLTVLQFPGKVRATQDVNLSFRVSVAIEKMAADEGSHVRAGQLIAQLDDTDYRVQLSATEAEYKQVKSECERVIALHADGVTTDNDYEKAISGLEQITAKLNHHRDQVAYTRLYAPFDGYIQKRHFDASEIVAAGMPVVSAISSGALEVEINLPTTEYLRRDDFSSAYCTFDFYPDRRFEITPLSIAPKANANQLHTMRFALSATDSQQISAGMITMVSLVCSGANECRNLLVVRRKAVFECDGETYVYKYSQGKISRRSVKIEKLMGDGRCVISSTEIAVGDDVVAAGLRSLHDGDEVEVMNEASATNVGGLL